MAFPQTDPSYATGGCSVKKGFQIVIVSEYCQEQEVNIQICDTSYQVSVEAGGRTVFPIFVEELNGCMARGFETPGSNGEKRGVIITSDQPIYAYFMLDSERSSEGETILPKNKLGTEYILSTRSGFNEPMIHAIVASEPNTTVQLNAWQGFGGNPRPKSSQTITLTNPGDVYSWDYSHSSDKNFSLTATNAQVLSDKPVAVYTSFYTNIYQGTGNGEDVITSYLPVSEWGREYAVAQTIERKEPKRWYQSSGDLIEIIGEVGTQVTVSSPGQVETFTIPAPDATYGLDGNYGYGNVLIDPLTHATDNIGKVDRLITSDRPIQVHQTVKGLDVDNDYRNPICDKTTPPFNGIYVDPEIILVLPTDTWVSDYYYYSAPLANLFPASLAEVQQLDGQSIINTIVVKNIGSPAPITTFEKNGVPVPSTGWQPLDNTGEFMYINLRSEIEPIRIRSTEGYPFGLYYYSLAANTSAVMTGGYGPLEEITLCDQCADVDIFTGNNVCQDEPTTFESRLLTERVPDDLKYAWNFGNGETSTDKDPTITFDNVGVYNVQVIVYNPDSSCVVTDSKPFNVDYLTTEVFPIQDSICLGDSVKLEASSDFFPKDDIVIRYNNITAIDIPDNQEGTPSQADMEINISEAFGIPINLDSICFSIRHPRPEDLKIDLITPGGDCDPVEINVFNQVPSTGRSNFRKTCVKAIADAIDLASPPYSGTYGTQSGVWPASCDPQGTWTLSVTDNKKDSKGAVLEFSLYFTAPNRVVESFWTPGTKVADSTMLETYAYPDITEPYVFNIRNYNKCFGRDTSYITVPREPIELELNDTVVCSVTEEIDLFDLLPAGTDLSGTWTATTGSATIFGASRIEPENLAVGEYEFEYQLPIFCGFDFGTVKVTINQLPDLGVDTAFALCNTESILSLHDLLGGTPDVGGFWASSTSNGFDAGNGLYDPTVNVTGATHTFQYYKPIEGCPIDTAYITATVNQQLYPGRDGSDALCEADTNVVLYNLLSGRKDTGGVWKDLDNTKKLNADGEFNLRFVAQGTYQFEYFIAALEGCVDTSSFVEVTVNEVPTADILVNFEKVCKDSTTLVTVEPDGNGPFNLTLANDKGLSQDYNNVTTATAPYLEVQDTTTKYFLTKLVDSSVPQCSLRVSDTLRVRVVQPIVATLIDEVCTADNSLFRAVVLLSGGEPESYREGTNTVTTNPYYSQPIPTSTDYTLFFTDGSNCPDNEAFVEDFKSCRCEIDPGLMGRDKAEYCEGETAVANVLRQPFLFDSFDTVVYVLHDKAGKTIGDTLAVSDKPEFSFLYGQMEFDKTYYISAIVANKDASHPLGLDITDTCYDVSAGFPIEFNALPVIAEFPTDHRLCNGSESEELIRIVGQENYTLYFTDDKGANYTFSGLADSALFILEPEDTTQYTLTRIEDGNNPQCSVTPNRSFTINVVDIPTAEISGGGTICESEDLTIVIELTGNGGYEVTYNRNGSPFSGDTIRTNSTYITRPVSSEGEYAITSIKDQFCQGIVVGTPTTVRVKKRPNAFAGTDITTCGLYGELNAIPSHGVGRWSGPGVFGKPGSPESTVTVPSYGTFSFTWTEENDPCPSSSDIVEVTFIEKPRPDAGNDTVLCVRSTPLNARVDDFPGTWFYLGSDTGLVFEDPSKHKASVSLPGPGVYPLIWREVSGGICAEEDTVVISVFDPPSLDIERITCNDVAEAFSLKLTASAGDPATYKLNGELLEDAVIYTEEIPTGTTLQYVLSDESSCKADTVNLTHDCECITEPGSVSSIDTILVCGDVSFQIPYLFNQVLDPNDTLRFVMHTKPFPEVGDILLSQKSSVFENPLNGEDTTVYYITAVAGNKIKAFPQVKLDDRCLVTSASVPVKFVSESYADMQDKIVFCENETQRIPLLFSGKGSFSFSFSIDGGSVTNATVNEKRPFLPVNLDAGSYLLELLSFEDNGKAGACSFIKRRFMEVEIKPTPSLGTLNVDDKICKSELASFSVSGSDAERITWMLDNETINLSSFNRRFTYADTHIVRVNLFGANGCNLLDAYVDTFEVGLPLKPEVGITGLNPAGVVCAPGNVTFNDNTVYTSVLDNEWEVSTGQTDTDRGVITTLFENRGDYTVKLTTTNEYGCVSSVTEEFEVVFPDAVINMNDTAYCQYEKGVFSLASKVQTELYTWQVNRVDTGSLGANLVINKLQNNGAGSITLSANLESPEGCRAVIDTLVNFVQVSAAFDLAGTVEDTLKVCPGTEVGFVNNSDNANSFFWNLDNGQRSELETPDDKNFYVIGENHVWLVATDTVSGCSDRTDKYVIVRTPPALVAQRKYEACLDHEVELTAEGPNLVWKPATGLSDTAGSKVIMRPTNANSQYYTVTATDEFGCKKQANVSVNVLDVPYPDFSNIDTSVVIGDRFYLNLPENYAYQYEWTPSTGLSCRTCPDPLVDASTDRNYKVTIVDYEGCYDTATFSIRIATDEKYSLALPDAFTPNGDRINPVIFPDGWGVDSILVFNVYDRFGELVHSAAGKKWEVAWDGKYRGKLMPQGPYSYKVVATFFRREGTETKTGTFRLIR